MPEGFHPRGAEEVRRAGLAFIQMRSRIERQIEQRTAMLSGVSHDLRTILTRFKLQLALAGHSIDTEPLNQDIADMQTMLEGYLAFARGEGAEETATFDVTRLCEKLESEARLRERGFKYTIEGDREINVRPNAFSRLVSNLVSNAFRHAQNVELSISHVDGWLKVIVDDDGPGIPEDRRRTSSSLSCGLMRHERRIQAAPAGLALRLPATSHAAMAATLRWRIRRSAACAPPFIFRLETCLPKAANGCRHAGKTDSEQNPMYQPFGNIIFPRWLCSFPPLRRARQRLPSS